MCGLCGAFDATHWTQGPLRAAPAAARRAEQVAAANEILRPHGLRLQGWGARFLLRGATGKTLLLDHLGALWAGVEIVAGGPLDPLEPKMMARRRGEPEVRG